MKKRIASIILILSMIVGLFMFGTANTAAENELPLFSDVKGSDWFYDVVSYNYLNKLMKGTSDILFEPSTKMSRAMFITVLGRIEGAEESETDAFGDIEKNTWYSGYVGWAHENGIVEGFEDGTFKPDKDITREEAAKAIISYIEYIKMIPTRKQNAPAAFSDEDDVSTWAANQVQKLRATGIIEGDEKGNFNPSKSLNRAEAAAIFSRLHKMKEDLRLEEPVVPSYLVEGEDFNLLGAYQMYYAGTALNTDYKGSRVDTSGEIPALVRDDNGRKALQKATIAEGNIKGLINISSKAAEGNYFALDTKILCIDVNEYPYLRVGYRISDGGKLKFGIAADSGVSTTEPTENTETGLDGWKYAIIDLAEMKVWEEADKEIKLTFMTGTDADIELTYAAMFKTSAEAESFDILKYSEYVAEYDGDEINYSKIDDETLNEYMTKVDDKIDEIMNAENIDPESITGTCYYVSSINGDDSNDGKSPETAWKTLNALYDVRFGIRVPKTTAGDAIFFERGSVFYTTFDKENLCFASGVTCSAYGKGDKPLFTHAFDINGSMDWEETEYENVYRLKDEIPIYREDRLSWNDVGNIVFTDKEGKEGWGIKILPATPADPYVPGVKTVESAWVTNGYEVFYSGGTTFENPGDLKNNLEYFHNYGEGSVYLYFDKGNPGEYFKKIILSINGDVVYCDKKDVVLDNLAIKYTGGCGLGLSEVNNVTIQNCDFEWIGGALQSSGGSDTVRFGNAIQNWGSCDGFYIKDCYINQVYDAGLTTQGSGTMINTEFTGNVIENTDMVVELFNHFNENIEAPVTANLIVSDNLFRYGGYGLGNQRAQQDKRFAFFYGCMSPSASSINVIYENNLNLYGSYFCMADWNFARGAHSKGVIFRNNTYLMGRDTSYYLKGHTNFINKTGSHKTRYPYTEQYIRYLTNLGFDTGSTFYYYEGYFTEEERLGVYRYPESY